MKIISGGQTGADRAALDAAIAANVECGGWCPSGRLDEDGVIPARYPLREVRGGDNLSRTVQNILESDATMIVYFGRLRGGTEQTLLHCILLGRAYVLVDAHEMKEPRVVHVLTEFVTSVKPEILNVAGPRASEEPGAYQYVFNVLCTFLEDYRRSSR